MEKKYEIKEPKVNLLGYTQTVNGEGPESIVASAARLCYSKVGVSEIMEKNTDESNAKFIEMLSSLGHASPFEHASYTFGIEGISRTCSHQIVRHRTGKYSQQSQRYVDLTSSLQFIVPPEIAKMEDTKNLYIESILNDMSNYEAIYNSIYENYLNLYENPDKKTKSLLAKKALEDARFALPNACETKIVMTMDARNLMNFFQVRLCSRAQWEIRQVAEQMIDLVLEVSPNIFAKAGASCVYGKCSEGAYSCGIKQEPRPMQRVKK